jgi:UDP-N-acetyl-2-amino-2-deoxyglucuronate dehydrogenase
VQMDCYWNRDQRYYSQGGWHGTKTLDGGTLFTQFSHFVDTLYWVFGDIAHIQTRLNDFNHGELTEFEDSGFVHFDFVQEGMGSLNFSTAVWGKNLESSLTVIAEYGSVRISGQYMERMAYCHVRDKTWPPGTRLATGVGSPGSAPAVWTAEAPEAHHRQFMENVVDVLKGRAESDIDPEDGVKVVDIIERIYKG